MRKIAFILCAVLCIGCLFSCGGNNVNEKRDAYNYAVEAIAGDELNPIHLKAEQIEKMKGNISRLIELEGDVLKVCQIQKTGIYAYVIEFDNENDAKKLCEEREGKGMYVWCEGNVAVYGNNETIKTLK